MQAPSGQSSDTTRAAAARSGLLPVSCLQCPDMSCTPPGQSSHTDRDGALFCRLFQISGCSLEGGPVVLASGGHDACEMYADSLTR